MAPRSLRKTFLGCKRGQRLGEGLYIKEVENDFTAVRIYNYNCFLKTYSALKSLSNLLTSRAGRFSRHDVLSLPHSVQEK